MPADEACWEAVGQELARARRALRLSKREAARRARIADITWRQYEAGKRQVAPGVLLPINPSDDNLAAAALAVEIDPGPLFEMVGRTYSGPPPQLPSSDQLVRLDAVERRLNDLEAKVDLLLAR